MFEPGTSEPGSGAGSEAPTSGRESRTSGEFSPGELIGQKYRLVRCLGQGGMASVWVAHNEPLDIHVAIKFIRADLEQRQLADRLLQEARAAARLGHPAIVRVSDFGKTERGDPYIVMELLSGEDLGTALERRGRLPAIKAVRTVLPIAHALAMAHDKGIVHRDLKPENVFLAQTEEGSIQPKLVDFGIAKLENESFKRLTDMGTALGSPGYMSPEQARGEDVDHRSDIWALCVVLYEAMTGRLPFDGKSYNALLRSIIEDTPAPITNFAAGDPELWTVLEKGFAKVPDQRWQTMRELGAGLARWLLDRNIHEDIAGASLYAAWFQWRKPSDAPSIPPSDPGASGGGALLPDTQNGPAYVAWPRAPSSGPRSSEGFDGSWPSPAPARPPAAVLASTQPPASGRSAGTGPTPVEGRPSLLDVAASGPSSRAWRVLVFGLLVALVVVGGLTAFLLARPPPVVEATAATGGAVVSPAPAAASPQEVAAEAAPVGSAMVEPAHEGEEPPAAAPASAAPRPTQGAKARPPARSTKPPAAKGDLDIKTQF